MRDLNVRVQTIKLLEENLGGNLPYLGLGNDSLDIGTIQKSSKLKTFVIQKTPWTKRKHTPQNGRWYSQIIYPVRCFYPGYIQNSTVEPNLKIGQRSEQTFSKEYINGQ